MTPDANTYRSPQPSIRNGSERASSSWDLRNAPRNYISLVVYQAASAIFSFGSVWLIARFLGGEGYGGLVAIIAASQVAQVFVNWTSTAVVRFGVDEFIESQRIARAFWVRLFVLAINFVIVAAAARLWFPPLASWLKLPDETFWLVIGHFAVTVVWIHVQMSLQAAKMPRKQGFLMMVERALIFAGLLMLITAGRFEFSSVAIFYILAPAAMVLAGVLLIKDLIFSRFSIDGAFWRKIIAYSVPLLPFSLVGYLSGAYIDAIFVSYYLSTYDLGIYSVATQISGIVLQLPTLASTLLLPLFVTLQSENDIKKSSSYFRDVLPTMTLLWGIVCATLACFAYFVVPFIFGAEFESATRALWILLMGASIALPALLGYFPLANARSETYILMVGATGAALMNFGANILLIPRYGLAGCALATALSYLANVIIASVFLRRTAGLAFSWTLAAILPALICGLIPFFSQAWWHPLLVYSTLATFISIANRRSMGRGINFLYTLAAGKRYYTNN